MRSDIVKNDVHALNFMIGRSKLKLRYIEL